MKEREVLRFIKEEAEKGRQKGETSDTIFYGMMNKAPDRKQFEYCMRLYILVQTTCDAICDPMKSYKYSDELADNIIDFESINRTTIKIDRKIPFNTEDYRKYLKYLVKELKSRDVKEIFLACGVSCNAFYLSESDAQFHQFALWKRNNRYTDKAKSHIDFNRLYKIYQGYKDNQVNACDISKEEFELLQDFKKMDEGEVLSENINKVAMLFHSVDKLGLSDVIDFEKIEMMQEAKLAPIKTERFNLYSKDDLNKFYSMNAMWGMFYDK